MHAPAQAIDWSSIIEDNRSWIERVVVARTGTRDGVDDVMQEVGLAVARSSARPGDSDEMVPWLCKIVVRQCALFIRNQARQRRKLDGFHQNQASQDDGAGDPVFWLLQEERKEIVREELARMDAQSRQILVWKHVHGLRHEDIGSRLGVARHVAQYRVIEARKELCRRLLARGIERNDLP